MKRTKIALSLILLLLFSFIFCTPRVNAQPSTTPSSKAYSSVPIPSLPSPNELLNASIPHDVPLTAEQIQSWKDNLFPELQRQFDSFSWQSFLGVNALNEQGRPQWETWTESLQVFRPDGRPPGDEPPRTCPQTKQGLRELLMTSSVFPNGAELGISDEFDQAFTSALYDQNGNPVRYEVFINNEELDYIVQNQLYNLDGQINFFSKSHQGVSFPSGANDGSVGAIELKLAWKEIAPAKDIPSRFFTDTFLVPIVDDKGEPIVDENGNFKQCDEKLMGLVGMHISHKTQTSLQWIWSTFEHVDNLRVNDLEIINDKRLHPLFHDDSAAGQTLPVNVPPIADSKGIKKTQVARPIPISKATEQLNSEYQALLKESNSVLQYYELISTQWPTDPTAPPVPGSPDPSALPEAITRKSSGAPAPVYLTNSIMETYLQAGNQQAHFQENGFPFVDTPVFGTESCMGCHFSAGIAVDYVLKPDGSKKAIFGGDQTADFSWLLQLKANFLQTQAQVPAVKEAIAQLQHD